jgi:hypothetical protein
VQFGPKSSLLFGDWIALSIKSNTLTEIRSVSFTIPRLEMKLHPIDGTAINPEFYFLTGSFQEASDWPSRKWAAYQKRPIFH